MSMEQNRNLNQLSKQELMQQLLSSQNQLADATEKKLEIEQLTHNLQAHQIELEIQNRELIETQKTLEQSRNRYADLYDSAPVGYLTLNRKGEVMEINRTGARMLGRERTLLIHQPLTPFLAPQNSKNFFNHLEIVFSQPGKSVVELKLKEQRDCTAIDVHLESAQEYAHKDGALCRCAMVDITERKQMMHHLKIARLHAEQANRTKTEILSRVSHEFHTPLNAIIGFSQLLEGDSLTPSQRERIQHILKAGWNLVGMVDEMLEFTRAENNKTELKTEVVELESCVRDSILAVAILAQERQIIIEQTLDAAHLTTVLADSGRLKQVLVYLLIDIVKYNQARDRVTISCQPLESIMRIAISDTGKGVPEANIATIFEPFSPNYLSNHGVDGSGLGLAIAKILVEEMSGTIGVTSKLDQGTTFWIELPRADSIRTQTMS
jgi:PAS domain S-box-containing protein